MPQINAMMQGMGEINDLQENAREKVKEDDKKKEDAKPDTSNKPKVNDIASLMGALGGSVKLTAKARKAMEKLANKK